MVVQWLGSHRFYEDLMNQHDEPYGFVNTPSVIYRVGHGENWSGDSTVPNGASRTDQYELKVQSQMYRHFFWRRPKPTEPPVRTFVWDHISEVLNSSDATDLIVIYTDFQNNLHDSARRWQDIARAAQNYAYAEHPVGPVLRNWPNSKYQFPWESPGNNSNTFIREMARVVGRNADVIGGNHPGAQAAGPVPDPGYVPTYSPWP